MFSLLKKYRAKLPLIVDMLFSILVFPFGFTFLEKLFLLAEKPNDPGLILWPGALYAALALVHLFHAFRLRGRDRGAFPAHLIYSAAFALCVVVIVTLGFGEATQIALEGVFWGVLIAERVRAIVRNHRPWSVVLNVILILAFIAAAAASMPSIPLLLTTVAAAISSFISIMIVIFSGIKLDVLKEIIRKTYAAEIIVGLLLMIVTFSYVLKYSDDAFTTFWDGLWYCFAVVTTIGFGDLAATSAISRIITVILGIYGIIVVALITSIIVNFYGEMKKVEAVQDTPQDSSASDQDREERPMKMKQKTMNWHIKYKLSRRGTNLRFLDMLDILFESKRKYKTIYRYRYRNLYFIGTTNMQPNNNKEFHLKFSDKKKSLYSS